VVLVDELATNEPGSLELGMGYTVPVLADQIKGRRGGAFGPKA
jgi:hypothetical protein